MQTGTNLGHFRVVTLLGRGGMGEVWEAEDLRLHRRVALKVLPPEAQGDADRLARFRREAEALAALNHPNIVTVFDLDEHGGTTFLAMELVHGTTLAQRLAAGPLPLPELMDLGVSLVDALAAAHDRGVIHRDLKPGNIMVTPEGRPKILDFGLALLRSSSATTLELGVPVALTHAGTVLGTPAYMAPEQLCGRPVDHRCDLFAFGVVLYEIASGRSPFAGRTVAETVSGILRDAPPPLRRLRPDIPAALESLVERCLAKDLERRAASARELHRELSTLAREAARANLDGAAAAGPPRSLAVLPFDNLSHDPSEDFFADGMTDALITDLARATALKVIARTSVMRFKNSERPLPEIARDLGVEALVVGSVARVGDRIRVSAQLVDASNERCLWADRFDRPMLDVLTLQDEIARAVAGEIDATLRPVSARGSRSRSVDPEVYLLDVRGRYALARRTEAGYRTALECFQQAINRDPTYASAHLGLADGFGLLSNYGIVAPTETRPRVEAALERAAQFDANAADLHRAQAFFHWQFLPANWQAALDEYDRALALSPGTAVIWQWSGTYLGVLGRSGPAEERLLRAFELDPLSLLIPSLHGWAVHYFARRFHEAIPYFRQVLAMDPDFVPALWWLAAALTETGDHEEALVTLEKGLRLSSRMSRLLGYLGYACGRAGKMDRAREILAELRERGQRAYVPAYFRALVHAGLGERPAALDELERSWAERDTMLRDLKVDPPWDTLRDEPRFVALMRRMAYPG